MFSEEVLYGFTDPTILRNQYHFQTQNISEIRNFITDIANAYPACNIVQERIYNLLAGYATENLLESLFQFLDAPAQREHPHQVILFGPASPIFLNLLIMQNAFENAIPEEIGANEKQLEALNVPAYKVPKQYCCALLQGTIMDDPVYDPNLPNIKFDRRNIERHLRTRKRDGTSLNQNPFTRQPLTPEALVEDTVLKQKIEAFMIQRAPFLNQYKRVRDSEVQALQREAEAFIGKDCPPKSMRRK